MYVVMIFMACVRVIAPARSIWEAFFAQFRSAPLPHPGVTTAAPIPCFNVKMIAGYTQQAVAVSRTRGDSAQPVAGISIEQFVALKRPSSRELRHAFPPIDDFTGKCLVGSKAVLATPDPISVAPFAKKLFLRPTS